MFDLRIKEAILKRSWKPTAYFLMKFGVNQNTARKMMDNTLKEIKLKTLFDVCLLLNCTPNDLLDIPDKAMEQIPTNHPLRALKKSKAIDNTADYLKTLPESKLDEAKEMIKKLWLESNQTIEKDNS